MFWIPANWYSMFLGMAYCSVDRQDDLLALAGESQFPDDILGAGEWELMARMNRLQL